MTQTPATPETHITARTPQTVEVLASDGVSITARVFDAAPGQKAPLAQVVIHGATATPQSYYAAFATHLAESGMRATMADWAELDAAAVVRDLVTPGVPFFAVGHSFGGQIAAVLPEVAQPDAMLLVGAQRGYVRSFDDPIAMWIRAAVAAPVATSIFGYLPGWLGTKVDLPKGVARQWMRWCLEPDYYLSTHPHYGARLRAYRGEALMLSFTDDAFAPLDNVLWLIDQLATTRMRHHHVAPADIGYPHIGHFGAFRSRQRDQLWRTMRSFLELAAANDLDAFEGPPDARDQPNALVRIADADIYSDLAFGR